MASLLSPRTEISVRIRSNWYRDLLVLHAATEMDRFDPLAALMELLHHHHRYCSGSTEEADEHVQAASYGWESRREVDAGV